MEAVSSYIWKLFARAQALSCSEKNRIGIPIDGRSYLNLPQSYFGNGIAIPSKECYAEHILEEPLNKIAGIVRSVISGCANNEYFKSFVDLVEEKRPPAMLARVYAEKRSAVVVSSGMRIPLYQFDLGCGRSTFSSVYFPWGGTAGYVMLQMSPIGDGNMVVYMHMTQKQLDAIVTDPDLLFVRANQMNFL